MKKRDKLGPTIEIRPLQVTLEQCGSFAKMMTRFKRKVSKDGVLKEYRERQSFTSPSEKRRKKKRDGIYETKKREREKGEDDK